MNAAVSPEAVMALAIVNADRVHEPVLIEKVSSLFATLRQEHIEEVGRVALKKVPHGLYSEDVEAFFGRLVTGGFAEARSPLNVYPKGIQLCRELIDEVNESHPEALEKVARVLGFDLAYIKNPTPR
jgi:hypothetical protein